MQPQQMFGLPYERAIQFRDVLEARNQTFADFVTEVIRSAVAITQISPDVPEFHIRPEIPGEARGFVIGFADLPKTFMPREIAAGLADTLRQAANLKERFRETQGDTYYRVARQSKGVRVTIPANSMTRKYNADLAEDIAAQIDRALDRTD
ncbi:hypothetical protein QBD01_001179 [Ochrobactrum sp. 19YEA23]|uniref:hypothetical protein n=1 Tax=Ochrobactrum sp. 19YEA23 TaxID=3039854 RepID=UPI00247AB543|nr:hypothetical protein [Ochrobactrum sp. 19YEA23]